MHVEGEGTALSSNLIFHIKLSLLGNNSPVLEKIILWKPQLSSQKVG